MTQRMHREHRRHRTSLSMALSLWMLCLSFVLAAEEEPGEAEPAAAAPPVPAFRGADHVAIITIDGIIDGVTFHSVERRVKQATKNGADAVVIELATNGGDVYATLDICALLKDRTATPANVVAWVHPKAFSAGAIMALACREIVVSPSASFGAAAVVRLDPLMQLQQLKPDERAKFQAPVLAEVIDSARRYHYDENLVQSFVAAGFELWLIEHVETGRRIVVDEREYRAAFGSDPPMQIAAVGPPRQVFSPYYSEEIPTVTEEEYKGGLEFAQQLPPARVQLTEADRGQWRFVTQITTNDRLLALSAAEALYYGLAVTTIADDTELQAFFGAQTITRYGGTWSESMVRVLVSLPVRVILIAVFLIALFVELAVPGVGVFGATAVIALLILIGAPWLAGMAQWWDVLLIIAGLLLVGAEILVVPGFGVAGVAGAVCLLAGIVGTFVTGDITSPQGQDELFKGILSTLIAIFAGGVGIWLVSRQLKSFPLLNRIVLQAEVAPAKDGPPEKLGLLEAMGGPQRALNVGDVGVAATDLRPAGRGQFDDRVVDVQSPGRYIEKGRPIRVLTVGRYVIEVEEVDS